MATFTATPANWTNSSDANFRSWGSYYSARLAAVGLVQTADTGQINWTTVTTPAGTNTYQGYEIWRFNDALQATAPVYMKIQYGEGSSVDGPGVRYVFGTGSDGAGNLTGSLSANLDAEVGAIAGATVVYGSGSTNRFVMNAYASGGASAGMIHGFERSLDADGNVTNEAIFWFAHASGSLVSTNVETYVWNLSTGGVGSTISSLAALFPSSTGVTGLQTIVAPVFPEKGVFMNPCLNLIGYLEGDIAVGSIATVYMYGAAHTYVFFEDTASFQTTAWRGNTAGATGEAGAIRYE